MNTCYDKISRQKGHSLSFPSLSNTQSSAQSSCSHRPQAHSTHSLPDWSRISSSYVVKHIQHSPSSMLSTRCIACIRAAFGGGCVSLLVFEELTPSGLAFRFIPILAFLVLSTAFRDFSSALRAFSSAFRAFSSSLSFAFLAFSSAFHLRSSSLCLFFSSLSFFFCSFSSASSYFFCSFSARIASASALVNKRARGGAFLGPEGVEVPGRTKYLDKALTSL